MQAVEIKNLSFVYSKKTPYEKLALKDINLSIEEGSFVGIVGATGSGKSTLIQHLNGLIKLQDKKHSSVVVNGMSLTDKKFLKKLRFEVGMVFQYPEYQLFEDTVAKDIAFGPKNMKLDKDEIDRRVRRALEVVGLEYDRFAERSPFDLSGGEKRRVAIAGVIAMQPKILVLDEPVAGLDPVGREEILALVKKLQKEVSPTVIIVSHNMDDMAMIADRIIALKDGQIVSDGTPKEVFGDRSSIVDAGLDLPTATRLADELIARGIPVGSDVVTMDELSQKLGELLRKKRKNVATNVEAYNKNKEVEDTDSDVNMDDVVGLNAVTDKGAYSKNKGVEDPEGEDLV